MLKLQSSLRARKTTGCLTFLLALSTYLTSALLTPDTSLLKYNILKCNCITRNSIDRYHRDYLATSYILRSHNVNIDNHEEFLPHHDHKDEKSEVINYRQQQVMKNSANGRRTFVQGMLSPLFVVAPERSFAVQGAVRFPCINGLGNKYYFMRAGESMLEEEGVWTTNPLFLTNQDSVLSSTGISQVENACKKLEDNGITITLIRYSLAANAVDASNISERKLRLGRDRIVPEFNFMDPRAIGMWDMSEKYISFPAVLALDVTTAGQSGTGGRPPPNIDGTPHETLADQTVRLRQLLSVLETQYSGDSILLIFPDGTGPALLTCLIGGIPFNRVHEFEFQAGEVRLDINYKSAHDLINIEPSDKYLEELEDGKVKLKRLLENPEESLDVKDKEYEEELKLEQERRERKKSLEREQVIKREEKLARLKKNLEQEQAIKREKREEEARLKQRLEREQAIKREEEARLKKERQLADIARRKEVEEEIKKKRDAQLAEMKKQKEADITKLREKEKEDRIRKQIQAEIEKENNIRNEPGGTDLLVEGGALIGAGGAAFLLLQNTEDSEIDPNDEPETAHVQGEDVAKVKAADEGKAARLEAAEVAKLEAEEEEKAARVKAEKVAKLKAEEKAAHLQAEEDSKIKAEKVAKLKAEEAARLQAEEDAKIKAEKAAKLETEEKAARLQAEEDAKIKAEKELMEKEDSIARQQMDKAARLQAEEDARINLENEVSNSTPEEEPGQNKGTEQGQLTWNPDEDDGGLVWLNSLAEMMNEGDNNGEEK